MAVRDRLVHRIENLVEPEGTGTTYRPSLMNRAEENPETGKKTYWKPDELRQIDSMHSFIAKESAMHEKMQ
jgi:hypothetical protein